MAIILATTTITVRGTRPQTEVDPDAEGYDPPAEPPSIIATEVRACITKPKGSRDTARSDEVDDYTLKCDEFPAGLTRYDTVTDDSTGVEYDVRIATVSPARILGLSHIIATLRERKGLSANAPSNT